MPKVNIGSTFTFQTCLLVYMVLNNLLMSLTHFTIIALNTFLCMHATLCTRVLYQCLETQRIVERKEEREEDRVVRSKMGVLVLVV